ncbi:MAG: hypothetical protein PHQ61_07510 [Candidatus Omnitrophica bacterium]|nr:hypothetical protein [Candidatus Omnitrophota bacterium]
MIGSTLKKSFISKAVSLSLAVVFSLYNVSFAMPEEAIVQHAIPEAKASLPIEDIGIAIDAGTIKSRYAGDSGKVIVHIQDAHCNFEAQSNINKILDQLTKECGIRLISVEGAEGVVDTSWFRAFPDADIRKEVATYFMKKGEITGAEFFSIVSDYNGKIFGAENREYYIENLKSFTEVFPYKESIEDYFKGLRDISNRLKTVVYSPELLEVDSKIREFDGKDLELGHFAAFLNKEAIANGVSTSDLVNFTKLLDTLEYEDKIDFDTVDQERSAYIEALSKKLNKEEMTELVGQSIKFKKGYIKAVDFYTFLRDLAKLYEIPITQEYPNLFYYYIYTKLYEGIDNEQLFKEIDILETRLKDRLFKDDTQRTLDRSDATINMYVNLVNIELTNEDYDVFKEYLSESNVEEVVSFIKNLSDRYGMRYEIGTVPAEVKDNLPKMVNFYEIAMKRDRALIDNTLKFMEKEGNDRCVLIAGGFHTRGIKDLLEKAEISYLVVTPKITKDTETPYIKVLTNQRTSLEDIITESSAMTGAGATAARDKVNGKTLSPLMRFAFGINLWLKEGDAGLNEWSIKLTGIDGAETFEDLVKGDFETAVKMLTERWLDRIDTDMVEKAGMTPEAARKQWSNFVQDDKLWNMLQTVYIGKYDAYFADRGEAPKAEVIARIKEVFSSFRREARNELSAEGETAPAQDSGSATNRGTTTPGTQAAGSVLKTDSDVEKFDEQIRTSFLTGRAKVVERTDRDALNQNIDERFHFVTHEGFNDALEAAGLPVNVHPGRGGADSDHALYQAHMDKYVYDRLSKRDRESLARHELAHLLVTNAEDVAYKMREAGTTDQAEIEAAIRTELGEQALELWKGWEKLLREEYPGRFFRDKYAKRVLTDREKTVLAELQEMYVNALPGANVKGVVERMNAITLERKKKERAELQKTLESHSRQMADATADGKGPDVVIVVSSTDEQAKFWQERLTSDGTNGSGAVVKKGAVVLSVPETNWKGGAGNGLGTLNGYVQAARKAQELGLISTDVPTDKVELSRDEILSLIGAFSSYLDGKSAFMFHTAGKGTRTAPLPGAEGNSKPNIKLPKVVDVRGSAEPITILESVIMETSIYAENRENRLGVFWGDQVIINQKPINAQPTHHVEIFGQNVPLDESIKSYGVLIAGDQEGDAMQREKLPMQEVLDVLRQNGKGPDQVYKSIGSFTISNGLLSALLADNVDALQARGADPDNRPKSLDTDPDWWQPLTSTLEEYKAMMAKKGKSEAKAEQQWRKMNELWSAFDKGALRKVGVTDVGKNSLWWDYGQNKYYLSNMQILTEKDTVNGVSSRAFFGIDSWISGSVLGDTTSVDDTRKRFTPEALTEGRAVATRAGVAYMDIRDSIVQNSTIKGGRLRNCVVINSYLENVVAENAVIIGSTIIKLNANDALVYNVVDDEVSITSGQLLTNIFHPTVGRIQMRTDVTRDGSVDWNEEKFIYDNLYTYNDIAQLMAQDGVTIDSIQKTRDDMARRLRSTGKMDDKLSPAEMARTMGLMRAAKVQELKEKAGADRKNGKFSDAGKKESWAARISSDEADARRSIAYRMMVAEGVPEIGVAEYLRIFALPTTPENIKLAEAELGAVRALVAIVNQDRKDYYKNVEPLKFGTSGLRDTVEKLTDMEVYINTRGFVRYLIEQGEVRRVDSIAIAGDLRPSTPRLMTALAKAIEDEGLAQGYELTADLRGYLPSPSVALEGFIGAKPSIMVTGSHIPADRNGIKFNKKSGEVLKQDERGILSNVAKARAEEYSLGWEESLFNQDGSFKTEPEFDLQARQEESIQTFVQRYTSVFPADVFSGKKVFIYQHSAVGRDIVSRIYRELGAEVITPGVDQQGRYIEGREEDNIIKITYTDEKTGEEVTENINLRSEEFVPVDTEKVSNKTRGILAAIANKYRPDVIISTDGDSDRPLFVDDQGNFLTGDKLGLLVTKFLAENGQKPEMVSLPVSTNEGVVAELERMDIKVVKTKIGSPHVVKAMNDWTKAGRGHENELVLSWEANGGFLLGSDIDLMNGTLRALPTRDAVLPLIASALLAKQKGLTVQQLIDQEIPHVYNTAGVFDDFRDQAGRKIEGNQGFDLMASTVKKFSPKLKDKNVIAVNFAEGTALRRVLDQEAGPEIADKYFFETEIIPISELDETDLAEWDRVRDLFGEQILTSERGFGRISTIDILDGIKVVFDNGEVSHFRPSGNAPEFRNYTTAATAERANEMVTLGVNQIIPSMVEVTLSSPAETVGPSRWTPGRQAASADGQWAQTLSAAVTVDLGIKGEQILATGDHEYAVTVNLNEDGGAVQAFDQVALVGRMGLDKVLTREELDTKFPVLRVRSGSVNLINAQGQVVRQLSESDEEPMGFNYLEGDTDYTRYVVEKTGDGKAVVDIYYVNDLSENAAYGAFNMVRKHQGEIKQAGSINNIMPARMFIDGNDTSSRAGTREWYQEEFQKDVSDGIAIRSYTDDDGLKAGEGLELAMKMFDPRAVNVLYAKKSDIDAFVAKTESMDAASAEARERTAFIQGVKFRILPEDIFDAGKGYERGRGLMHTWETIATGLTQAAVTPDVFAREYEKPNTESILWDLKAYFDQTRPEEQPEIEYEDLYGLLSYSEVGDLRSRPGFAISNENILALLESGMSGFLQIVNRLLATMPIRPFNPTDQLHQRRKVMWSV